MPAPFIARCKIWPSASGPPVGPPRATNVPCRLVDTVPFAAFGYTSGAGTYLTTCYVNLPAGTDVRDATNLVNGTIDATQGDWITLGDNDQIVLRVLYVAEHAYPLGGGYRRAYCLRGASPSSPP